MLKLTDKEKAVIIGIAESEYRDGYPFDYPVWSWSIDAKGNRNSIGGVVASLSKKGLTRSYGSGDDSTVQLTPAGVERYMLLKSNET